MKLAKMSDSTMVATLKNRLKQFRNVLRGNITESKAVNADYLFYDNLFLRWLRSFGIDISAGKAPSFKEGGTARVYFIGNKAVKITDNRVEVNVAKLALERKTPNVVVLGVKKFGDVYAIVMPVVDMKNIDKYYIKASDYLTLMIDDDDFEGFPAEESEQREACLKIIEENDLEEEILPYMLNILKILRKLYDDTGFVHTDATPSNIGMYNKKLVIPDLGPNQGAHFSPEDELSKISKSREKLGLPPTKYI